MLKDNLKVKSKTNLQVLKTIVMPDRQTRTKNKKKPVIQSVMVDLDSLLDLCVGQFFVTLTQTGAIWKEGAIGELTPSVWPVDKAVEELS